MNRTLGMIICYYFILEEFQTPFSSPPSPQDEESLEINETKSKPIDPESLQTALHSVNTLMQLRLPHEHYLLCLSDLQISVGKAGEHWSNSSWSGGSNELHLLDKFTLSIKIQR